MTPALQKAKALLDAIDFDQHGAMVAGQWVGGNGGLISRETIKAADELRKALAGRTSLGRESEGSGRILHEHQRRPQQIEG